jgi:hypothetical protein
MTNPGWADWAAVEKVDPEAAEAMLAEARRENSKIRASATTGDASTSTSLKHSLFSALNLFSEPST